jgi:[protein-PII] uridylyltransferase
MSEALTSPEQSAATPTLRDRVNAARAHIKKMLAEGQPGFEIARWYAGQIEALVIDQFEAIVAPRVGSGVALLAQGGFGRQELAPFSDVDLLLLVPEGMDAGGVAQDFFTSLWDAGLEPGNALRTQVEALTIVKEDHTAATALVDARPLAGDMAAARILLGAFWEQMHADRLDAFISAKVQELEQRQQRFGGSVYLLEPNVKTGVGGLRDLATGLWIAHARHRAIGLGGIAHFGLLPRKEIDAVRAARDTLWRLRCQLHLQAKRRDDRLTFAAQEQASAALGYQNTDESLAVELMMRDYYLAAHAIEHATEALIDRCVREAKGRKGPVRPVPLNADLELWDNRVTFRAEADLAAKPSLLVDVFVTAERERVPVLSSARDRVSSEVSRLGASLATNKTALDAFLQYLVSPGATGTALRGLYEAGVLGGLFPEFARLKSRVQHDVYHVYTVDTHTLFALQKMLRLRAGLMSVETPEFTRICQDITRPLPLYLGLFFHDLGKHMGGNHSVKGEELIRAWGVRVGMDPETIDDAAFLVREHLTMSSFAFRRDLSDPSLLVKMLEKVGTRERLDMLYLLTYVDISSVGPETWTDWRSRLLAELHAKCRAAFGEGGSSPLSADRTQAAVAGLMSLRAALHGTDEQVEKFLSLLPERYLATVAPASARVHFEAWKSALRKSVGGASGGRPDLGGVGEFVVVTEDRPGLLALVAGTLAAHSIDILSAEIFSLGDHRALDAFIVREPGGLAPSPERLNEVTQDLELVLSGRETVPRLLARRHGTARRFAPGPATATKIKIDLNSARDATIFDVWAQDRVGLLHDLADAIYKAGAFIALARIATEGNSAADGFYLQDLQGHKITDPEHLARIENSLRDALRPA